MKSFYVQIAILLLFICAGDSLRSTPDSLPNSSGGMKEADGDVMLSPDATGSSLPDCSHACGPCFPCKRVMVSFKCSIAESCPIVYRCMCKGRYYHVPSN
ncbi:protein EPIDERMAL PATTERNING FACTOR 2-like isoform X2 [Phalaenopsis equestris]|uniref:protein EPIDERMAL PATTERNING FACTOR 2-like isoform X2 n=1 Tax=Phalaenopsis equestris TaxID=78828 RepID=UPI0009E31F16|nr:protein EPIDERMAL PATTERNING FACTOR 2-like isoform X2 [Phalaenopsis equestris]